jgi:hypothetical protein
MNRRSPYVHPIWELARAVLPVAVVCSTLLLLQLQNSTSFDWVVKGEGGTLAGVSIVAILVEYLRQRKS